MRQQRAIWVILLRAFALWLFITIAGAGFVMYAALYHFAGASCGNIRH